MIVEMMRVVACGECGKLDDRWMPYEVVSPEDVRIGCASTLKDSSGSHREWLIENIILVPGHPPRVFARPYLG